MYNGSLVSIRPPRIDDSPQQGYYGSNGDSNLQPNSLYTGPLQSRSWSCVSSKTPEYKRLKKHQLPINYFLAYGSVDTDSVGTIRKVSAPGSVWIGVGRKVNGMPGLAMENPEDQMTAMRDSSALKALLRAKDSKMNLAQAFAERKQTASLLKTSINRFVSVAFLIKAGNLKQAQKLIRDVKPLFEFRKPHLARPNVKDFPNAWLEYSYGWRPLLSDIYGGAEACAKAWSEKKPFARAVGVSSYDNTRDTLVGPSEGLYGFGKNHYECFAKTSIDYEVTDEALTILSSTGISNPIDLAWELLPYSFVIDWLIPVGSYTKSLDASFGLRFLKGYCVSREKWFHYARARSDNSVYTTDSFYRESTSVRLFRNPLTEFPNPAFPSISLNMNASKTLSALSLLSQIFNRPGAINIR